MDVDQIGTKRASQGLQRQASDERDPLGLQHLSVATVHDWLPVYAGAERVLEEVIRVLPATDVYSLIDFLPDDERDFLQGHEVRTSFIQRLPFARRHYRYYLPLAPFAIEQFDLTGYDLVISSSYVVAKGVLTSADQLHISYVHSPVRYAWDLYFQHLKEGQLERGIRSLLARAILHYLRLYDVSTANRVDVFVANSKNVARRIWKTYRRHAEVVYPPVHIDRFPLCDDKEEYYLTMSRLVPYKRIDLIVKAFSEMKGRRLVVIGDGPDLNKIKALATPNVDVLGYQPFDVVLKHMMKARAFIFAAEEDFGIVPVEAQACGTPVIGYGKGGLLETVIDEETGLFFTEQSEQCIKAAVEAFESKGDQFVPAVIRANAERFSANHFTSAFSAVVEDAYRSFRDR